MRTVSNSGEVLGGRGILFASTVRHFRLTSLGRDMDMYLFSTTDSEVAVASRADAP